MSSTEDLFLSIMLIAVMLLSLYLVISTSRVPNPPPLEPYTTQTTLKREDVKVVKRDLNMNDMARTAMLNLGGGFNDEGMDPSSGNDSTTGPTLPYTPSGLKSWSLWSSDSDLSAKTTVIYNDLIEGRNPDNKYSTEINLLRDAKISVPASAVVPTAIGTLKSPPSLAMDTTSTKYFTTVYPRDIIIKLRDALNNLYKTDMSDFKTKGSKQTLKQRTILRRVYIVISCTLNYYLLLSLLQPLQTALNNSTTPQDDKDRIKAFIDTSNIIQHLAYSQYFAVLGADKSKTLESNPTSFVNRDISTLSYDEITKSRLLPAIKCLKSSNGGYIQPKVNDPNGYFKCVDSLDLASKGVGAIFMIKNTFSENDSNAMSYEEFINYAISSFEVKDFKDVVDNNKSSSSSNKHFKTDGDRVADAADAGNASDNFFRSALNYIKSFFHNPALEPPSMAKSDREDGGAIISGVYDSNTTGSDTLETTYSDKRVDKGGNNAKTTMIDEKSGHEESSSWWSWFSDLTTSNKPKDEDEDEDGKHGKRDKHEDDDNTDEKDVDETTGDSNKNTVNTSSTTSKTKPVIVDVKLVSTNKGWFGDSYKYKTKVVLSS